MMLTNASAAQEDGIPLSPGLVIRSSTRIAPGTYHIPADSAGAIRIAGSDITIDFTGAILQGSVDLENPDTFAGTGIFIEPGANVTLTGATVRGFKVAIMARDTPGLSITESELSYNWRQRLKSTIEREHNDDWMSYHDNESDQWLRFGAAVYLRGCSGCRIEGVTVTGGQNGLLLADVNDSVFQGNRITFNSSLGIGMYRSSRNRVLHNTLDFNVRGYSHGVYNRGQDSAAILVYEQSNDNEFGYNSATHSGDGFFLWAGQTTMDTGEGGCNGNVIHHNDFSFAPTNGIEITFSTNEVRDNYIEGCWHGIWGGYSFDTVIEGNTFVNNEEHIAIEHGQDIQVTGNVFSGGDEGLRLWERDSQPPDWGYSEARDVRSRDYEITGNTFLGVTQPINADRTTGLQEASNHYLDTWQPEGVDRYHPRDRSYILVDEWGPHDFRSPAFWPRSPRRNREQWFEIVGPSGDWVITSLTGVDSVSALSGSVGDSIRVWRTDAASVDLRLQGRFTGSQVTDRFGRTTPAGQPFAFDYAYLFVPIDWTVDFWEWERDVSDPREQHDAFSNVIAQPPIHSLRTQDLGFGWSRSPADGVPADYFATRSVGQVTVPEGAYLLDLTSDDGVRVFVDGALVHEDWTWHAPRQEEIVLQLGGQHQIVIEHFEIDGFATLVAGIRPKAR
ncbi:MAG: parallel beta-helix repeat protein [Rhodothermales bacterium]|jgi:parallel beta-helix repeat protein